MDAMSIIKTEHGLHIEGFPTAVKFIRLDGPKANRVAHLALHRADLEFARDCVELINKTSRDQHVLRQSLWCSAITHFIKCFGDSKSRFSLERNNVYKGDPGAHDSFEYFKNLRNKHIIHDENPFVQCEPGAVLNGRDCDHKIARVISLSLTADTLCQENWSNLHLLVTRALEWVEVQYDNLCTSLTKELECKQYDDLIAKPGVIISKPGAAEDVGKTR